MKGFLTLLSGALLAVSLFGQAAANKGQIVGTVLDQNQAVIPNAKVTVRSPALGVTRELTSGSDGRYQALFLDAGVYEVSVSASGFAEAKLTNVIVNVGSSVDLPVTLNVGATAQSIEVGAQLVSVDLPAPQVVAGEELIRDLPINGRRFQDFAALTPTVQIEPSRQQLSFVGQRGINANVMLDGTDYTQPFFGGIRGGERSNFAFTVPQSAIQEFQVITQGYAAEYGRSTGGILNSITKSGTNDVRGEAFYLLRHKSLAARNPILNVRSSETQHQFGGAAGGALKKDKIFWFSAVEQQFASNPRNVVFANLNNATPGPNTNDSIAFYRSLEERFRQTNDATAATGRLDYQFERGHRLTFRYNFSNNNAENAVGVGGALNPNTNAALSNEGIEKNRTHTGTLQYTYILSPKLVNDLRFSGIYEIRPRLANSATPTVTNVIGTFGTRSFLPTTQDDQRWQIVDGLSFTAGKHTAKFGFDFSRINAAQKFGFNQFGSFTFLTSDVNTLLDILSPGGAIANRFDSPQVNYTRQIGNLLADYSVTQFALYAQDSWKLTRNFTLDFGLRWEGQYNPTPQANNTAVVDRVRNTTFPLGLRVDPTRINDNTQQWMPRFGFAWSPWSGSRRMVVRGNTGLFYAATPLLLFAGAFNNFRNPPGDVSIQLTNLGTLTVYQQLLQAGVNLNTGTLGNLPVIPIEVVQRAAAIAAGGVPRDPFLGISVTANSPNYQNPRSFQTGLGADLEIVKDLLVGAQFNYVNTVNLQRNVDVNLPFPTVRAADGRPIYNRANRPIPTLQTVTLRDSSARSLYRGATFQAQYRKKRLQFNAFYSVSETFSDDDNERNAGGFVYDNVFNLKPEFSYSDLDARHQFTSSALVNLPWGFDVSGTVRARTGYPMNPRTGADTNGDNSNTDRAYQAVGQVFKRNSFRNRGFKNVDLRVLKNFKLGERMKLQFSAELFNLFNFENVVFAGSTNIYGLGINASGVAVPRDPRFQQLRNADGTYFRDNVQLGTPLQAQFGLRFFF
jgi:hypothetical protein